MLDEKIGRPALLLRMRPRQKNPTLVNQAKAVVVGPVEAVGVLGPIKAKAEEVGVGLTQDKVVKGRGLKVAAEEEEELGPHPQGIMVKGRRAEVGEE